MNQGDFTNGQQKPRYYALDNLRVLAFIVLILYHIGMYYVLEWGWHIKSDNQYAWLQDVMLLTNQWRMSLLFLISAMVMGVLLTRYKQASVLAERTLRLLLPLIFGMFVIVAPQAYIEGTVNDEFSVSFLAFYKEYINPTTAWLPDQQSVIGLLTWNHLWFLPYLFCYSVLIALLYPLLNKAMVAMPASTEKLRVFMPLVIGLTMMVWLTLRQDYPTTHDLLNDWYSHAKYFLVMLVGLIIIRRQKIWTQLMVRRRVLLAMAIAMYAIIIAYRHDAFGNFTEEGQSSSVFWFIVAAVVVTNHWCWLGAILGYGKKYLSGNSGLMRYLNSAILPCYIFHQTIIVVVAYWTIAMGLPEWAEFMFILIVTVAGCLAGYEFVRRVKWLSPLFGLKPASSSREATTGSQCDAPQRNGI